MPPLNGGHHSCPPFPLSQFTWIRWPRWLNQIMQMCTTWDTAAMCSRFSHTRLPDGSVTSDSLVWFAMKYHRPTRGVSKWAPLLLTLTQSMRPSPILCCFGSGVRARPSILCLSGNSCLSTREPPTGSLPGAQRCDRVVRRPYSVGRLGGRPPSRDTDCERHICDTFTP